MDACAISVGGYDCSGVHFNYRGVAWVVALTNGVGLTGLSNRGFWMTKGSHEGLGWLKGFCYNP
jgi:hypothetical protein